MKTGRRCKWDEIAVGEVFAWDGCWCVMIKTSADNCNLLASNDDIMVNTYYGKERDIYFNWWLLPQMETLYKLPKSFQRCFIQWK